MRPVPTIVAGFAIIAALTACSLTWNDDDETGNGIAAKGAGTTRTYEVAGFNTIDLRGADDIDVRVGPAFSVRAEGPAGELDQLRIDRDGDTLKVGRKKSNGGNWGRHQSVRVFVTLPRLAGVGVSGSGTMNVDRVEGTKFAAGVAGSGALDVGTLQVDEAEFSIAGSGDAKVSGTARSIEINIAGSGNLNASRLTAQRADVSVAGSGNVRAMIDGAAKVNVMGSGDVDLGPRARCTTSKMGSGTVRCGG